MLPTARAVVWKEGKDAQGLQLLVFFGVIFAMLFIYNLIVALS